MPASFNGWSALLPGGILWPGEELRSRNGQYALKLNGDGNLVAVDAQGTTYWASSTQGHPDLRLVMQADGNLLLLDSSGIAWWDTYEEAAKKGHTYPLPQTGAVLIVQDDGNDVLYGADLKTPLWNTRQDTYDSGSGFGQWLARSEKNVIGAVATIAKITKAALPVIDAALLATGNVDAEQSLNSAVNSAIEAGAEIAAVDQSLEGIASIFPPDAIDGFHAAVGLLDTATNLSPAAILAARSALPSDAERKAFDATMQFAPQIADDPAAIAAARTPLPIAITASQRAQVLTSLTPRTTQTTTATLGKVAGALAPRTIVGAGGAAAKIAAALPAPASASPGNILAILAKANGLPDAASYVAKVHAGGASPPTYAQLTGTEPVHPTPPNAPPPKAPPAKSSGGGAGLAIALGLGAVALFALAR